jgi:2-iminobutanoate/2-iminopropanoate deaminase
MSSSRSVVTPSNDKLDLAQFGLPHASAVKAGDFVFLSGLIAVDAMTGERAHGTTASETRLILSNMASILEDAGSSLAKVVKTTVWLASMLEQEDMNNAYRPLFPVAPPARTVCGARLNYGMKVQIDCIALVSAEAAA